MDFYNFVLTKEIEHEEELVDWQLLIICIYQ